MGLCQRVTVSVESVIRCFNLLVIFRKRDTNWNCSSFSRMGHKHSIQPTSKLVAADCADSKAMVPTTYVCVWVGGCVGGWVCVCACV